MHSRCKGYSQLEINKFMLIFQLKCVSEITPTSVSSQPERREMQMFVNPLHASLTKKHAKLRLQRN